MKTISLLCLAFFMCLSSASFAADCGEVDNESFRFDFDGYLISFAVEIKDGSEKLYVTSVNSENLHRDILRRFRSRNFDDRFEMGLFVCFDEYTTTKRTLSSGEVRTYPKTQEHRLWENGELVSQFPALENLNDLADEMGEYFDIHALSDLGYDYKAIDEQSLDLEVVLKAHELFQKRSDYLSPAGEAFDVITYAVFDKESESLRGYIIAIEDDIDHPLWDGSGVTFYLDVNFDVTKRVEWDG